jgi:hypothetical protein
MLGLICSVLEVYVRFMLCLICSVFGSCVWFDCKKSYEDSCRYQQTTLTILENYK